MSEIEPIELSRRQASISDSRSSAGQQIPSGRGGFGGKTVFFDRRELDAILRIYGQMVAAGEWRDYAIDSGADSVTFSIFRRTSEMPLFRIVKTPRDARRQGAFRVVGASGMILKRGHDLTNVLKVLQKQALKVV